MYRGQTSNLLKCVMMPWSRQDRSSDLGNGRELQVSKGGISASKQVWHCSMGTKNTPCDSMDQRKQCTTHGTADCRSSGTGALVPHPCVPWCNAMGPDCHYAHRGLQPTEEPRARGSAPFVASGKQTNPLS